ncbi:mechanosensitive ion channel family protein [Saccharicrinis sp. FJH2]|uniref:mechanosensitive ion channel family protein n=1 Tax=unclassified Saccharicrinis TaxID=2646859 RepID=UPI0035D3EE1D
MQSEAIMDAEKIKDLLASLIKYATEYGLKLIYAVIVLIIGWWLIKFVMKAVKKGFERRNLDLSLRGFLTSLISITLKVVLFITVAGMLGIEMTSFLAVLGAAGLAIGMALKGTLSNFAGGVMILLLKPFKVGEYITGGGYSGTVSSISIFNTTLLTFDNIMVTIPNGQLSETATMNYTRMDTRRVDIEFGISYSDDIDKAKKVISDVLKAETRILPEPEFVIAVKSLGDSSVNITTRSWVKTTEYWLVYFDIVENVKKALDKNNITIPFPQRDVHLYNK